ncbi:hypothetical protein RFN28_27065 [Mesorhizobium sp. VK24D]|uniref:Uncharacterized protein n=1 Tax=Mesorhizobium album TaxID=3072314 RepID=A0ABU4Y836_9HYPH|nr:hypothetical protein [Mesorhizobium sp. VK24D]MDX8482094.1 hypothetical protein [Mesorhizobium sp. VK24D]
MQATRQLERCKAATLSGLGQGIAFEYPHTAEALNELVDDYEWQAKRTDDDSQQRD